MKRVLTSAALFTAVLIGPSPVPAQDEIFVANLSDASVTVDAGQTPTFAVFATATGDVPFDPAVNRIFLRFKDGGGVTRGSASVAVRTL